MEANGRRFSLSQRERAGVRGKSATFARGLNVARSWLRLLSAIMLFSPIARFAEAQEKATVAQREAIPITAIKRSTAVNFAQEILPILKANCLACHNRITAKAGLVLETPQGIRKGGESGAAVMPGNGKKSLLLQAASHEAEPHMPPQDNKVNAHNLTPDQLGLIQLWIDQGATASVAAVAPFTWQPLPPGLKPILAVAVTSDSRWIACTRGNRIFIYDLPAKQLVCRLTDPQLSTINPAGNLDAAHRDLIESLAFSPDGNLLASGSYREVKLWRHSRDARQFTLAAAPPGQVLTIAVSPKGRWIATASADETIQLWEASTGKPVANFAADHNGLQCLSFSPDSEFLASGSADHHIAVWRVPEGRLFARTSTPAAVNALTWAFDARVVASGHADHFIRLWFVDHAKRELSALRDIRAHDGPVSSLAALTPAGTQLLSGSGDGTMRQWNLEDGQQVRLLNHGGPVLAVAVRPDGKRFASAGVNGVVRLWDAQGGALIAELRGDRYAVESVAQAEREAGFATNELAFHQSALQEAEKEIRAAEERVKKSAADDAAAEAALLEKDKARKAAREAKTLAEKQITELNIQIKPATTTVEAAQKSNTQNESAPFTSAETKAAADKRLTALKNKVKAANDQLVAANKALEAAEKERQAAGLKHTTAETESQLAKQAAEQAFKQRAKAIAALKIAEEFQRKTVSDLNTARQALRAAGQPLRALAFSPDNRLLASAGDDRLVRTWKADDGTGVETFHSHENTVYAIGFSAQGMISGAGDGTVIAWDLNPAWKLERVLGAGDSTSPLADRVHALRFSPNGQWLATGGGEPTRSGEIKLWAVAGGHLLQDFPQAHSDTVFSLDFSPDGQYLASGGADKFARVLDLAAGKMVRTFEGHAHHVLGVAWHRNGRTLLTAGADNVVKVWDFPTGERKSTIGGFNKEVTSITFAGYSDLAFATSGDNRVCLVQLDGKVLRTFNGVGDFPYCGAVTLDGQFALSGGQDSLLHVWNAKTGQPLATFEAP